jgi:hypothetical protein
MKTTKILSAISLILIFAANSLFASRNTIGDPGSVEKQKLVTYEVKVNFAPNFPGATSHYMILITDGQGRQFGPGQEYHPGINTYTFTEAGSFRGTRIAAMVPLHANQSGWYIPPSVIKGNFVGGQTYIFNLTPQAIEKVKGNDM